ncbi:MAG TPA: heme-binding protein, partial [Planctomycetaceae bacterium]
DGFPQIVLQGGIGVFFPGTTGDASYEQGFVPGVGQPEQDRVNSPLELEAEYMAFAAVGGILNAQGTPVPGASVGTLAGIAPLTNVGLPLPAPATVVPDTIFLGGIELPLYGPGPIYSGTQTLVDVGRTLGVGDPNNGVDVPLTGAPDGMHRAGLPVANGWLVTPHDAAPGNGGLTAADVTRIIETGVDAANATRAAIRLPLGSTARMVLAVTDTQGNVLGLYRMPDATTFSIQVAVAKARNVAYYDSAQLLPQDQVVQQGVSFTNRTFRFLAEPRFPAGVENTKPPPFSTLNDPGIDPATGENIGAPLAASNYLGPNSSVAGHDAFVPESNFHQAPNANQSGIVFFPGSTALYRNGQLIGGLGISGDGVDQDDTVTFVAAQGYLPTSSVLRADQVFFANADDPDDFVRLPFIEFLRNAFVL